MAWNREAELALKVVSAALDKFHSRSQDIEVLEKENARDIVTQMDHEIENQILKELQPQDYFVIAEESRNKIEVLSEEKPYWVVDPIDGTVNFANKLHYYGIAVGLCQYKKHEGLIPLTAAFGMPETKDLFFMDGDTESYWNGKKLLSRDSTLKKSLVVSCFSARGTKAQVRTREYTTFGEINDASRGVLRIGSASTAMCYTAALKFQAAYGIMLPVWDSVPGLAIAKGAGLERRMLFRPEEMRMSFIVGAKSAVQEIEVILERNGLWNS
jgi:myo-inositol-1(or 4)-monophosphatase